MSLCYWSEDEGDSEENEKMNTVTPSGYEDKETAYASIDSDMDKAFSFSRGVNIWP